MPQATGSFGGSYLKLRLAGVARQALADPIDHDQRRNRSGDWDRRRFRTKPDRRASRRPVRERVEVHFAVPCATSRCYLLRGGRSSINATIYALPLQFSIALLSATGACAQLPKSGTLSARDERSFRAELSRLERLSKKTADRATVDYALARTWAAGRHWPKAMQRLRLLDPRSGIDPSRDRVFAALRGTVEFEKILEGDLAPESLAYDSGAKMFYFGCLRKGKVVQCSAGGICRDFLTGLSTILGLKVDGKNVWVA